MASNKFAAWLVSDFGRKCLYIGTGATTTLVSLAHILPHSIFLDKYKEIVHLYRKGFSVPLTPKLQQRFQKTLDLLKVDERDQHLYKPFAVYGFDVFSAGSSYSHFGVAVGLPANFFYETESDVDKTNIKVAQESVPWDSEEGKAFQKALVLSENAQMYGIAREIKFRQTMKPFIDVVSAMLAISGYYGLSNGFNIRLNLHARPVGFRAVLYCLVAAFTAGTYSLTTDFSQVYYEESIDTELKSISPVFVEGGREFYEKILERNKALRKLLGKEGERVYTVLGNENYFLRYKHVPLVQRKSFFEQEQSLN